MSVVAAAGMAFGVRVRAHVVEHHQWLRPPAIVIANGIEDAVPRQRRDQLLQEQRQQGAANRRQIEVMNLEQSIQLHSFPILHELSPAEDDDVVGHQGHRRLGDGGERRLTGYEPPLLGFDAAHELEGLGEDGP